MKTENVKTCQKSPNFGAIRVPVSSYSAKFNPKTIMDVMEHHIPSNRIKISRGKTKNGEIVDYIMTRFNSLKEKNIFDEIVNLGEKFTTTSAKKTKKDTVRFDKARQPLGDEVHVLGVDADPISGQMREYFRENLLKAVVHNKICSQERLSERNLKSFVKELTQKPYIESKEMQGIVEAYRLYRVSKVQNNAYIGAMLHDKKEALPALKKAGIERIIDLDSFDESFMNACNDAGLDYTYIDMVYHTENPSFRPIENLFKYCKTSEQVKKVQNMYHRESRHIVGTTIKLIKEMNKGNYFMGCQFCAVRTPNAISLSRYFNPQDKTKEFVSRTRLSFDEVKNLYKNFTEADKKCLDYTPEFEKRFED